MKTNKGKRKHRDKEKDSDKEQKNIHTTLAENAGLIIMERDSGGRTYTLSERIRGK